MSPAPRRPLHRRHAGLLSLFPAVASLVQQIPEPVLGGATIVMFGTIAAAGVRIISTEGSTAAP